VADHLQNTHPSSGSNVPDELRIRTNNMNTNAMRLV